MGVEMKNILQITETDWRDRLKNNEYLIPEDFDIEDLASDKESLDAINREIIERLSDDEDLDVTLFWVTYGKIVEKIVSEYIYYLFKTSG
jgi:hypothetical protein